jgi:hypothetical protein
MFLGHRVSVKSEGILMRHLAVLAMVLLGGCAASTSGPGGVHQGAITVASRAVPLPPGDWRVIGSSDASNLNTYGGSAFRRVALVQETEGRLSGLILIGASDPSPQPLVYTNAPNHPVCRVRGGELVPIWRSIPNDTGFECRRISWVSSSTAQPAEWETYLKPLVERRAAEPGWVPQRMLRVAFALADRRGWLSVDYDFDAERGGIPATQAGGRAESWESATRPAVVRGFRTGSTDPAPAF